MTTPTLPLNSKNTMPSFGLGTWRSEPGLVAKAVEHAILNVGYSHIDCAAIYGNEPEIGGTFKNIFSSGKVKRSDIFVTSKLWNSNHRPEKVEAACKKTLQDLQLEYLDLYLIHWGVSFDAEGKLAYVPIQQTWQAMEKLVENGLVKNIGVANFMAPMILDLLSYAQIKPAVNQIEIHPYNTQEELVEYCQKNNVQITAYSPLGSASAGESGPLHDPVITKIAEAHKKTPAQVLIKWSLQRNLIVIPKSTNSDRITENSQVWDYELTDDEMKQINGLNKNHRYVNPDWGIPYFK